MHDEAVTDIDDAILQLTGLCFGYYGHVFLEYLAMFSQGITFCLP